MSALVRHSFLQFLCRLQATTWIRRCEIVSFAQTLQDIKRAATYRQQPTRHAKEQQWVHTQSFLMTTTRTMFFLLSVYVYSASFQLDFCFTFSFWTIFLFTRFCLCLWIGWQFVSRNATLFKEMNDNTHTAKLFKLFPLRLLHFSIKPYIILMNTLHWKERMYFFLHHPTDS